MTRLLAATLTALFLAVLPVPGPFLPAAFAGLEDSEGDGEGETEGQGKTGGAAEDGDADDDDERDDDENDNAAAASSSAAGAKAVGGPRPKLRRTDRKKTGVHAFTGSVAPHAGRVEDTAGTLLDATRTVRSRFKGLGRLSIRKESAGVDATSKAVKDLLTESRTLPDVNGIPGDIVNRLVIVAQNETATTAKGGVLRPVPALVLRNGRFDPDSLGDAEKSALGDNGGLVGRVGALGQAIAAADAELDRLARRDEQDSQSYRNLAAYRTGLKAHHDAIVQAVEAAARDWPASLGVQVESGAPISTYPVLSAGQNARVHTVNYDFDTRAFSRGERNSSTAVFKEEPANGELGAGADFEHVNEGYDKRDAPRLAFRAKATQIVAEALGLDLVVRTELVTARDRDGNGTFGMVMERARGKPPVEGRFVRDDSLDEESSDGVRQYLEQEAVVSEAVAARRRAEAALERAQRDAAQPQSEAADARTAKAQSISGGAASASASTSSAAADVPPPETPAVREARSELERAVAKELADKRILTDMANQVRPVPVQTAGSNLVTRWERRDGEEVHADQATLDDPGFRRDLANAEILDHICGQIDRNLGNMMIEAVEGGGYVLKLIDNDFSFPTDDTAYPPREGEEYLVFKGENLPTLPKAVDRDLAGRLAKLDVEGLIEKLSPYLLPAELDALEERIARMRSHVGQKSVAKVEVTQKKGALDWRTSSPADLFHLPDLNQPLEQDDSNPKSYFGRIHYHVQKAKG